MGVLVQRVPWTRRPPAFEQTRIDRNNPLGKDVVLAWLPDGCAEYPLWKRTTGTAGLVPARCGDFGPAVYRGFDGASAWEHPATVDPSLYSTTETVWFYGNQQGQLMSMRDGIFSASFQMFISGGIISSFAGNNTAIVSASTGPGSAEWQVYSLVVSHRTNATDVDCLWYRNGKVDSSSANRTGVTYSPNPICAGARWNVYPAIAFPFTGGMAMAILHSRALQAGEIASLHRNPHQIWLP